MTPYDLRPLALGELLDRSFALYRRHFTLFVGIMAVPSVIGVAFALVAGTFGRVSQQFDPNKPPPAMAAMLPYFVGLLAAYLVLALVHWVLYMFALGATTTAVAELYAGREVNIPRAFSAVRSRIGGLLWLAFLGMLRLAAPTLGVVAIGGGLAALARGTPALLGIVAIIGLLALFAAFAAAVGMALGYAVCVPTLVLERVSAGAALRRSVELTRGNRLRVFVIAICAMVLTYAAVALFQGPFLVATAVVGPETDMGWTVSVIGAVTGSMAAALTAPVLVIALAVLYYDLRVRKEALDLQVMIGALDAPAGGQPLATSALPGVPES